MRKKSIILSLLAGVIIIGSIILSNYHNPTSAKSQPTQKERMARYSPPHKQKQSNQNVQSSTLNQMNIVSETANVLNVLPINIIDEMQKGKTILQIAQEKGLSEKDFTQKLADYETKAVNDAVSKGIIPKKHADAINAGRANRIKQGIKEKGMKVTDNSSMSMGY